MNEFNQEAFKRAINEANDILKAADNDVRDGNLADAQKEFFDVYKCLNVMSIELDNLSKDDRRYNDESYYFNIMQARYYDSYGAYLKAANID